VADYTNSLLGVTVDLRSGTASGGDAQGDIISGISGLQGSGQYDSLIGDGGDNRLDGGSGNDTLAGGLGADTLIGGGGNDAVDYIGSIDAVTVDLAVGTGRGGEAEGDVLSGISVVTGSALDDRITGTSSANRLDGGSGNDSLSGGGGADTLIGGGGLDTADYTASNQGVTLNLATGLAAGGDASGDVFVGITRLNGSNQNDVLTGDELANSLRGGSGADTLSGGLAVDTMAGGLGRDLLTGGEGGDVFVFDHKPGSLDWDTLADFEGAGVPDGDVLQLSHAIFSTLAVGALSATAFQSGLVNVANNAGTRIVYNQSSGELFYDADGSGSGAALKLAVLANHPSALSADDFLIV
jgi:Ca2+-binding RTX toxin-like protein